MTILQWANGGDGHSYGFSNDDTTPVAMTTPDARIWVTGFGTVYLPPKLVLIQRQKQAIASLLYCHLIGEIDLEEIQR